MRKTPHADRFLTRIRGEVPHSPGVYLFLGESGEILYIGKSKQLNKRVASYFHKQGDDLDGRIRRMIFNIRDFTIRETATELEALLLEDRLIKTHLPPYNVRQKKFRLYQYLLLTEDAFPTLRMLDSPAPEGRGRLFGPFRDQYFVKELLELIHRHLGLRLCVESRPVRDCMDHDLGICSAPCRNEISKRDYAVIVNQAKEFLEGEAGFMQARLEEAMEAHAARLEFEKAAALREQLEFVRIFCERQCFIQRFAKQNLLLRDGKDRTHLFLRGAHESFSGRFSKHELEKRSTGVVPADEDRRFLLDRANIVYGWLRGNSAREHRFF